MARVELALLLCGPLFAQPQVVRIYRDHLKPGSAPAYIRIEEDAARVCARLKCFNPYLALRSIGGPDEVWFLNFYDSDVAVEKVKQDYAKNPELIRELATVTQLKHDLILLPQEQLVHLQDDLSGGPAVNLGSVRFFSFTTKTFDPDHLKYDELAQTGWVYRAPDATFLVMNWMKTPPESPGPTTRVFAVVPSMSFPSQAWISADPEFWKK
jgi:hypothetical protein